MAYALIEVRCQVGDDSNLQNLAFSRDAVLSQTRDLEACVLSARIGPASSEVVISMGTVTTAYRIALYSDYPVLVRLNGASPATQFQLTSNNVPATNVGAPLPPTCALILTAQITSIRIAPIIGAAQTATVWGVVTGNPTSVYI